MHYEELKQYVEQVPPSQVVGQRSPGGVGHRRDFGAERAGRRIDHAGVTVEQGAHRGALGAGRTRRRSSRKNG